MPTHETQFLQASNVFRLRWAHERHGSKVLGGTRVYGTLNRSKVKYNGYAMLRYRDAFRNSLPLAVRLSALALSLSCANCGSTSSCTRDPDTYTVSDGLVFGNTYISAPNDAQHRGPWAHFPPARTLVFQHHLDGIPYQIAIWLAFQPVGTLAPSTGNLSIRQTTTDDSTIAIKNDTCSEYWAWVEASLPTYPTTLSEAGAPSSEAADSGAGGAH